MRTALARLSGSLCATPARAVVSLASPRATRAAQDATAPPKTPAHPAAAATRRAQPRPPTEAPSTAASAPGAATSRATRASNALRTNTAQSVRAAPIARAWPAATPCAGVRLGEHAAAAAALIQRPTRPTAVLAVRSAQRSTESRLVQRIGAAWVDATSLSATATAILRPGAKPTPGSRSPTAGGAGWFARRGQTRPRRARMARVPMRAHRASATAMATPPTAARWTSRAR